jgi:hypothetical protein
MISNHISRIKIFHEHKLHEFPTTSIYILKLNIFKSYFGKKKRQVQKNKPQIQDRRNILGPGARKLLAVEPIYDAKEHVSLQAANRTT